MIVWGAWSDLNAMFDRSSAEGATRAGDDICYTYGRKKQAYNKRCETGLFSEAALQQTTKCCLSAKMVHLPPTF